MSDTLLNLFSYDSKSDSCMAERLEKNSWSRFAARVFSGSLDSTTPNASQVVSMALAMDAGERGWMRLFERWAAKSHELGKIERDFLDSPFFLAARAKLRREEFLWSASENFRREYEDVFGYPPGLIWTAMEMR